MFSSDLIINQKAGTANSYASRICINFLNLL
jgi:hypothetical protein